MAAYSPEEQFNQYVIPVMNLNPAARQRHQLRIITVGFFRMLKCTLTNKVVKCKTEIVALKSFLDWLEQRKEADPESKGVVLIYYESIKFIPYMLLEALKKYDLVDRFAELVVGFIDGHALAEAKTTGEAKIKELHELIKEPAEANDQEKNFDGNAMVRARNAYRLVEQLAKGNFHWGYVKTLWTTNNPLYFLTFHRYLLRNHSQACFILYRSIFSFQLNIFVFQPEQEDGDDITRDLVHEFVHSVNMDINELPNQNKCIDLQHTFRPIFVQYFKTNLYHRYKAVTYRRVLAEKGFDLKSLEDVWNDKKKVKFEVPFSSVSQFSQQIQTSHSLHIDSFASHILNQISYKRLFLTLLYSKIHP